jgi:vitamin B12 transporter
MNAAQSVFVLVVGVFLGVGSADAQDRPVKGLVVSTEGAPVPGANVFVLETLDGLVTSADGRFSIRTTEPGNITLVVKRLGFEQAQRVVAPAERDSVVITLTRATVALSPVAVQAGAYTAGEERGATLTPLEVVTTPGSAADINRTIQTLPGVQSVDEGTGLYVRGGDFTETRVFLNEAPMLNPIQLMSPSGTFVGTVDPFLLDGIFFSSGGFGARYGDALSGVVGLRTRGTATTTTGTLGAGLAALSADLAVPVTPSLTIRAAGNRFNLQPVLDVNGATREFDPAPHGTDASGSIVWSYAPGAELKLFATDGNNRLGIGIDDPAFSDTYSHRIRSRLTVLNWRQVTGSFSPQISVSETRLNRDEGFGAFQLAFDVVERQVFAQVDWQAAGDLVVRAGGERSTVLSGILGTIPQFESDARSGARTTLLEADRTGHRFGSFVELDWRRGNLRLIPGLRSDYSNLTRQRTMDPRVNVAWRIIDGVTATGAWGIYHQVPDPLLFESEIGPGQLASMRARQAVAGLQVGEEAVAFRVEAWRKDYSHLAQLNRDHLVTAEGTGYARGVDLFMRLPQVWGFSGRSMMSFVRARRTDPNTSQLARAPYDISLSQTLIVERAFPAGVRAGIAWRSATGKPFTPITGAAFSDSLSVYVPDYGNPMSERFPPFKRFDASLSQYRIMNRDWAAVVYLAVSNVLDRANTYEWRYNENYTERTPIRSIFNRAVYFGASLLRQ